MEKQLVFLFILSLCFSSCFLSNSDVVKIKHTCFVFDIDRKPIVGKRVRYFETRTQNSSNFYDKGFVKELITDSKGKVIFEGTTDQTSIDVVAETDSASFQINGVIANNGTDSLFVDGLIPFKMRVRNVPSITATYTFRSIRITGSYSRRQIGETLLFEWQSFVPRKTPFDTIISTKILEKGQCSLLQGSRLDTQKDSDYRPFEIPISFNRDSIYLVEL